MISGQVLREKNFIRNSFEEYKLICGENLRLSFKNPNLPSHNFQIQRKLRCVMRNNLLYLTQNRISQRKLTYAAYDMQ